MIYLDDVRSGSDTLVTVSNVEIENDDGTTTLANSTLVTVFLQVYDGSGFQALPPTQATPQLESSIVPPATWSVHAPASALAAGKAPWIFVITVFGPLGLTDTLLHTESIQVLDRNT